MEKELAEIQRQKDEIDSMSGLDNWSISLQLFIELQQDRMILSMEQRRIEDERFANMKQFVVQIITKILDKHNKRMMQKKYYMHQWCNFAHTCIHQQTMHRIYALSLYHKNVTIHIIAHYKSTFKKRKMHKLYFYQQCIQFIPTFSTQFYTKHQNIRFIQQWYLSCISKLQTIKMRKLKQKQIQLKLLNIQLMKQTLQQWHNIFQNINSLRQAKCDKMRQSLDIKLKIGMFSSWLRELRRQKAIAWGKETFTIHFQTSHYRKQYLNTIKVIKNCSVTKFQSYFRMFYVRKIYLNLNCNISNITNITSYDSIDETSTTFQENNNMDQIDMYSAFFDQSINEFGSIFDDSIIDETIQPLMRPVTKYVYLCNMRVHIHYIYLLN